MKYIILLGDGMADYPLDALGGKTPLMAAKTPNMDFLVQNGLLGLVATIPQGFPPGSDVANLSIVGYDPADYYTGRAPLEAASLNIALAPDDVAFRCNLVTLKQDGDAIIMADFSAGHIGNDDSHPLMHSINEALGNERITFYPGVSYRHLMVWKGGRTDLDTTPPHDISGKSIADHLPKGSGFEQVIELMTKSQTVLADHPVNYKRRAAGKNAADSIWLWGQGKPLTIPPFKEKFNCSGAVISAVDLIKGIGIAAGLDSIDVPGATGFLDTNYVGKAEYALNALEDRDFVYVHVEAPDEAAHNGSLEDKIQAIEDFDEKVVGTVLKNRERFPDLRIMVLPDHATPVSLMTHTEDPVPFVIYPPVGETRSNGFTRFDEKSARTSPLFFTHGHKLTEFFILGQWPEIFR